MTQKGHAMRTFARMSGTLVLVAVFAAGPTALAQTALAQTAGTIDGSVVNGTEATPAAGIDVSLQLFSAQGDLGVLEGTTDPKGRFSFGDLPPGVAGYQVIAEYAGAEYRGIAQTYTPGAPTDALLTVYEPTTDPGDVTFTDYIVWVDLIEDGIAIQQDLRFANAGTTAYIGEGEGVVTLDLPAGATAPQFLGTFLETPGEVRQDTYVSNAPIVPGESSATLRFEAPNIENLSVPLAFPTATFQLYVPEGVGVASDRLSFEGTISDQGRTYTLYSARNLPPEIVIETTLTTTPEDSSMNAALQILLGVVGLIAVGVIAAWLIRRRRASKVPVRSSKRVKAAKARPAPSEARPKTRVADPAVNGQAEPALGEDAELIIDEIAALDLAFDKGLLEERAYKRLRVAAKDRLLRAQGTRTRERIR